MFQFVLPAWTYGCVFRTVYCLRFMVGLEFYEQGIRFRLFFPEKKKYFFCVVKNFPQQIENTREIIENMSEIF